MKKTILLGIFYLSILSGCSSSKLIKSDLDYKIFPQTSDTVYEFNLGIAPTIDNRQSNFVMHKDDYFNKPIAESFNNLLFQEVRASSAFKTIKPIEQDVKFLPSSLEIQNLKRTLGRDALLLTQIDKFNVNVRNLSDDDSSGFVKLSLFNTITYKIILSDSESIVFLKTIDTSDSKIVKLNDDLYNTINTMASQSIKKSIEQAKMLSLQESKELMKK